MFGSKNIKKKWFSHIWFNNKKYEKKKFKSLKLIKNLCILKPSNLNIIIKNKLNETKENIIFFSTFPLLKSIKTKHSLTLFSFP